MECAASPAFVAITISQSSEALRLLQHIQFHADDVYWSQKLEYRHGKSVHWFEVKYNAQLIHASTGKPRTHVVSSNMEQIFKITSKFGIMYMKIRGMFSCNEVESLKSTPCQRELPKDRRETIQQT